MTAKLGHCLFRLFIPGLSFSLQIPPCLFLRWHIFSLGFQGPNSLALRRLLIPNKNIFIFLVICCYFWMGSVPVGLVERKLFKDIKSGILLKLNFKAPSTMKWQIILDQVKDIELLSNSFPSNIAFGKMNKNIAACQAATVELFLILSSVDSAPNTTFFGKSIFYVPPYILLRTYTIDMMHKLKKRKQQF